METIRQTLLILASLKCGVQLGKSSDCQHRRTFLVELNAMLLAGAGTGTAGVPQ